jgi:hypothetical protein
MHPTARMAIATLEKIRADCGNAALAFWVTPNTILTLSGARPYCDGVFWDDDNKGLLDTWQDEINASIKVLQRNCRVIVAEAAVKEARPGEQYAGYELVLEDGLRYVLEHTNLVSSDMYDQLAATHSLEGIMGLLEKELLERLHDEGYDKTHVNDIAFGLLLGYPDKAMLESVKKWGEDRGPFSEPDMPADIRGADYYICPKPEYSYPRSLAGDKEIINHEHIWSTILKDYYTSDFHKLLEKDAAFQAKANDIGNIS